MTQASHEEINRAVRTFRSLENRRSDFAAMVEVLDEYDRPAPESSPNISASGGPRSMTPEESEAYKKFKLSQMTKISASGESVSGEERDILDAQVRTIVESIKRFPDLPVFEEQLARRISELSRESLPAVPPPEIVEVLEELAAVSNWDAATGHYFSCDSLLVRVTFPDADEGSSRAVHTNVGAACNCNGEYYRAARSKLEQLFREQQRLSNVCYVLLGTRDPEKVRDWINLAYAQDEGHRTALSSLKDSQLTPRQAWAILHIEDDVPTDFMEDYSIALEKLRSISSTPAPGNEK